MTHVRDYVVLVLAIGVGITLVLLAAGAIFKPAAFTPEVSYLLDTLGSAIVGALAVYLGLGRGERVVEVQRRLDDTPTASAIRPPMG